MKIVNIIDISSFVYTAFYAVSGLSANGIESGAIYGFCSAMLKITRMFPESMFIAAMDSSKQTFRNEIFKQYKANRKNTPEALLAQLPFVEEACKRFGFVVAKNLNFEADDIIASYVELLKNCSDIKVNIVSPDKDILQLLSVKNVNILDPTKKKFITEDDVFKKFGVYSHNILDVLSLSGDASDNVPGIKGVGPKTAASLIQQFKSLDNLIVNLDKLPANKRNNTIKSEINQAILSRKLISLAKNIPLTFKYQEARQNNLYEFFNKFDFKTLIKILPSSTTNKN